MSAAALSRIEKALTKLAKTQAEVCGHVVELVDRLDALESAQKGAGKAPSKRELIKYLDEFRSADSVGLTR